MNASTNTAIGVIPLSLHHGLLPDGPGLAALQKGMLLRFKKEIPQAIEVIEKACKLFEKQESPLGTASSAIELAWLYGNNNEHSRSEKMFQWAEELMEANTSVPGVQEVLARWLHYRGLLLYQGGDYGAAVKMFKQALTFCDPQGMEAAKIYDSLGVHYERTGDFHRAVRYLKSALMIKIRHKDPLYEEAVTCQILGRLHLLYEDYELAHQNLLRSLEICTDLKDEKRKATLKNELIRLFLRCGKEQEAMQLIQETRQECQQRHLKIQQSMTSFYEAFILYSHRQFSRSHQMLQKHVLPIFTKFRYHKGLAMAKRLQAWIMFALNPQNTTEPISLVCEAIELFRRESIIDEVAKSHFELGKLYYEVGNENLALASFLDALKMAEENGLFYLTPYIEDEIFRIHEPRWMEIVNKRTRHERIFEKERSLFDALNELIDVDESAETDAGSKSDVVVEDKPQSPQQRLASGNYNLRFLLSLLKLAEVTSAERDLDRLIWGIQEESARALGADKCLLMLYDEETNELWSNVVKGLEHKRETRLPANQGLTGYCVKTGETVNIQDAYSDPRFSPDSDKQLEYKTDNLLCMPIRNRKKDIIGVFQAMNKRQGKFSRTDEDLLMALTSSAAIAIENAQLYYEKKVSFESFIKTLSSTIDARDPITSGHSDRVMEYASMIGQKMTMSDEELEALRYAALLHDIGKIGVKEEILVKEGRLTEKEYKHIQEHVYYTHMILNNIHFEKHLTDIPEIAASHHEKMDGSGYYQGIAGENICLGGRILAVADVFDAITSRRQYRNRMPFERVVRILKDESGKHFDGNVVEAFLDCALRDLGNVLCMDRYIQIPEETIRAVLDRIPEALTILDYYNVLESQSVPDELQVGCEAFKKLYHFSEISDLD